MNNKSLFIIFIDLGIGGVQRKIVDIVNYLGISRKDLKIHLLLRKKTNFNLTPEIKNKNVKILYYTDYFKKRIPFFFPFFVLFKTYQLKPQAILAFLDLPSLTAVLSKLVFFWRKIKVALSEDHYTSSVVPQFKFGRLRELLIKIFYPGADVIFTCSKANKRDLVRSYGLSVKKIKIITNWTSLVKTRKLKKQKKKYDFLYAGRLEKVKRIDYLLQLLNLVKKKKKDIKLCLVGEGKDKHRLKNLVIKYDLQQNVIFKPATRKISLYYQQSKIFVFTAQRRADGFPLVILEAMALKTPILTTNFAGAKEFLQGNINCLFINSKKEFADKALLLLENERLRARLIRKAYQTVLQNHSPENIKTYIKALGL